MRATGICRRVDELGRVVIPIELRRAMDISEGDSLEIFTDNERILLKKYQPDCLFCGSMDELVSQAGKNICPNCIRVLAKQVKLDQATTKRQVP